MFINDISKMTLTDDSTPMDKKNGRPTKYRSEYAEQLIKFFSLEEPSYTAVSNTQGNVQMIPRRMPTLERFAIEINVTTVTLWNWANATKEGSMEVLHPEFLNAYTRAKDCQKAYILEAGVAGALNTPFVNLFMKNTHGWRDKVEQETVHSTQIDLVEIEKALEIAAKQEAENYEKMKREGIAGKYTT